MSTRLSGRFLALCGLGALALGVALLAAPSAGQVPEKALECNSDIGIVIGAQTPVAGGSQCDVTLTIANGLSRDIADVDVSQSFPEVEFYPSCTNTPCVPDPALPVTFVPGSASNTCGGMPTITVNPAAPGDVSFGFAPPFVLAPSAAGVCGAGQPCQCTISFKVFVPATAGTGPFPIEARIPNMNPGVCAVTGLTSSQSVVDSITKAPTLGAIGLLVLALILVYSAWRLLRTRLPIQPAAG